MFIYFERERERARARAGAQGRGGERGREENPKQPLRCQHMRLNLRNPDVMVRAEIRSRLLNRDAPPGRPALLLMITIGVDRIKKYK